MLYRVAVAAVVGAEHAVFGVDRVPTEIRASGDFMLVAGREFFAIRE